MERGSTIIGISTDGRAALHNVAEFNGSDLSLPTSVTIWQHMNIHLGVPGVDTGWPTVKILSIFERSLSSWSQRPLAGTAGRRPIGRRIAAVGSHNLDL